MGSTGSIGTQTLDVARRLNLKICALAANRNIRLLEEQIREFRPALAAVFDESAAKELKNVGGRSSGANCCRYGWSVRSGLFL